MNLNSKSKSVLKLKFEPPNVQTASCSLGEERAHYEYLPDMLSNYGRSIELGRRHTLHRWGTLYFTRWSHCTSRVGYIVLHTLVTLYFTRWSHCTVYKCLEEEEEE